MVLTVCTLSGSCVAQVEVSIWASVSDLKVKLERPCKTPRQFQELLFGQTILEDRETLISCRIFNNATINFVRMDAGDCSLHDLVRYICGTPLRPLDLSKANVNGDWQDGGSIYQLERMRSLPVLVDYLL